MFSIISAMSLMFTSDVSQDIVIVLPCCVSDNIVGCGFIDANVIHIFYLPNIFFIFVL